ncbi:MAG TPA: heavy metal sensor histidine kinase [Bryobacteraceae bacterium]|jgi:two-component system heavy metal sensor histidine kinase CusS|nr:heavy metal sensor histidine kinase [Bryobacteraceae bacterium]
MPRLSIRLRLTLLYSLVLLTALSLFVCGIWLTANHRLMASVDSALVEQAKGVITVIRNELDPAHPEQLQEELTEYAQATPDGNLIEVRDAKDLQILRSKVVAPERAGMGTTGSAFGDQKIGHAHYRTYASTALVKGSSFRVLVATPLRETRSILRDLHVLLLWTAPAVLLIAALGGYLISRRALAPVDEITQAARSIGIQNLSRRLTVPATGDELQRLSATWNDMLARLESAVKRLSQFTADASHELRTPIALIRTTAELTLRRDRSPEKYREALTEIVMESERTSRLVEDLLLLARADAGLPALPLENLELTPLVRDICEQGQVLAEARQLQISTDLPDEPVFVQANDPALRRLLLLLVDNAVKYTPAGGRITVSIGQDTGGATLAVRDTGIGIPDSALPHVFERFYRADDSRNRDAGGAGLGLSIAKWIAERHHASLEAESVLGQGSTFRVRFPLNG